MPPSSLLPRWLINVSWVCCVASIILVWSGPHFVSEAEYPETGPDIPQLEKDCEPQHAEERAGRVARALGWKAQPCAAQLASRCRRILEVRKDLKVAETRRKSFEAAIAAAVPDARRWLRDEAEEIGKLKARQRGLVGTAVQPDGAWLVALLVLSNGLTLGAMYFFSWHAGRAGITAPERLRDVLEPFAWMSAMNLAVASAVTYMESLGTEKDAFDCLSFCIPGASFWISHSSLLPLSLLAAAPLAMGWHASRVRHAPRPDPTRYRWGVGQYVGFLERWSFAGTVLVGAVAAIWIHRLAADPSQVNKIEGLLGFGALGGFLVVLARLMLCALQVRARYERLVENHSDRAALPPDPTEGFLGNGWKVPAALAGAFAVAYQLITWAGVGQLVGAMK